MSPHRPDGRHLPGRPSPDELADFDAYVRVRGAHLGRLARLLTHDRDDAEDLLQTVLVRALASWRRVTSSDDVDAYMGRILVNTYLSDARRRPREVAVDAVPDVAEGSRRNQIEQADHRQDLVAALRRLPPRQRVTVVLRHYADVSETEVAAILGCSVGTVRSQTSRGLATLRAAFAPAPDAPPAADAGPRLAAGGRR